MIGESGGASSQGQALVYLSIAWGIGTACGPLIGGLLARPCLKFAGTPLCEPGELLQTRYEFKVLDLGLDLNPK
jgi:MFS family permease